MESHEIHQWGLAELEFTADQRYWNPLTSVHLQARFTAPSGQTYTVDGFWDGGQTWRVRFCPTEVGLWHWETITSPSLDAGLHGQRGTFKSLAYTGGNPLYQHGPLCVSKDGHYLEHADGTPFFWLGDTAWNGPLMAREEDWTDFLRAREDQTFTVIQFVSTEWRGGMKDRAGEVAIIGHDPLQVEPAFFQRLDPKVAAINRYGMVAAPVILWAFGELDPGQFLSEDDIIILSRYIVARWGAYHVTWILAGDTDYSGEEQHKWSRVARKVFGDRHDQPVTVHPRGVNWTPSVYRGEAWFDFIGYQSGHGDSNEDLGWLVEGPPAQDWQTEPVVPIINLEPNYEIHPSYHHKVIFSDYEVRRASYWSLLVTPPAGITFGHNAIWVWRDDAGPAENHANIGNVPSWSEGIDTPGVRSMTTLHQLFAQIPWWQLRPAQELLRDRNDQSTPELFTAVAATEDRSYILVYVPRGAKQEFQFTGLPGDATVRWFNAEDGMLVEERVVDGTDPQLSIPASSVDWLVMILRDTRS